MSSIREQLHSFVKELLLEQDYHDEISDDESLILSGLVDSADVMHIFVFMEQKFDINFSEVYFDQTQFDTINSMVAFVEEYVRQGVRTEFSGA